MRLLLRTNLREVSVTDAQNLNTQLSTVLRHIIYLISDAKLDTV